MKWVTVFCVSFAITLALTVFTSPAAAYAWGVCSEDQTIMKLARSSNAHVALWDQSYGVRICYTDFFSEKYTEESDPHACTSEDVVLKLPDTSNAHAAQKSSSTYSTSVCYKGLYDCTIESPEDCDEASGKVPVAYLSGRSNAHLSRWPGTDYLAVCCKGQVGEIIQPSVGTMACYELNEEECGLENGAIAASDPGCGGRDSCVCVWNATQNICTLEWGFTDSEKDCDYKCVIQSSEQTECSGGSHILSLIATTVPIGTNSECLLTTPSTEESGCRSGSATVPCGSWEANLPFFGTWQILSGLLALFFVYALIGKKTIV